jgi:hypothetical protein
MKEDELEAAKVEATAEKRDLGGKDVRASSACTIGDALIICILP